MSNSLKLIDTLNVCIIGEPNSAKSTLLNQLINKKVTIVSRKAQTTLTRQRGVIASKNKQIIIYDTPGIFGRKKLISRGTFKEASYAITETNLALLITDLKDMKFEKINDIIAHLKYYNKK